MCKCVVNSTRGQDRTKQKRTLKSFFNHFCSHSSLFLYLLYCLNSLQSRSCDVIKSHLNMVIIPFKIIFLCSHTQLAALQLCVFWTVLFSSPYPKLSCSRRTGPQSHSPFPPVSGCWRLLAVAIKSVAGLQFSQCLPANLVDILGPVGEWLLALANVKLVTKRYRLLHQKPPCYCFGY